MKDTKSYLSKIVQDMPDSGIKDFFDVANTMEGALSLGVGEPDFPTPEHVREAAIASIKKGDTKYTDNRGTVELRAAAADYLTKFDLHYDKQDEILITMGASEGIDLALRTLVNPGEEVLVAEPSYVSYIPCIELCGGVPVSLKLRAENKFRLTREQLEEKITEKSKVLLISYPNNPTGAIMEKEDLEAIAEVVKEHDLFVITDEIYAELTYGKKHVSIASLPGMYERCVVLNGFSKAFAMTGWRIGFIAGPEWIVKAVNKLQGQYTSGPCSVSQKAAEAAYTGSQAPVEEMRQAFERRRNLIVGLAKEIPGFEVNQPEGAFYLFPKCSYYFGKTDGTRTIENADDLAMYLLEVAHVACVGGTSFGAPECIRMSYATSDENIVEAIKRIKEALAALK